MALTAYRSVTYCRLFSLTPIDARECTGHHNYFQRFTNSFRIKYRYILPIIWNQVETKLLFAKSRSWPFSLSYLNWSLTPAPALYSREPNLRCFLQQGVKSLRYMMQRGVKSMNFAEIFRCIMQWGDKSPAVFFSGKMWLSAATGESDLTAATCSWEPNLTAAKCWVYRYMMQLGVETYRRMVQRGVNLTVGSQV
jgi:hypothetical protein